MKKKIIALAMLCALVCMGLAACGSGGGAASSSAASASASAAAAEPIEFNKAVVTDDYELTLTGFEWTDELVIQEDESGSIQMSAKDNGAETMLVVKGTFKNLSDSDYAPGVAKVSTTVNGDTELQGSGTSPKLVLASGETQDVFYYALTTNDVKDSFENGTMTISFFNQTIDGTTVSSSGDPIASYILEF